jgi:hypothetical protein
MSARPQGSFVDSVAMRTRLLVAFGSLIAVIAAFQMWYFPGRQVGQARRERAGHVGKQQGGDEAAGEKSDECLHGPQAGAAT